MKQASLCRDSSWLLIAAAILDFIETERAPRRSIKHRFPVGRYAFLLLTFAMNKHKNRCRGIYAQQLSPGSYSYSSKSSTL